MSLIAVLIPLLFMGDVVGRLFRQFAITLAVTIRDFGGGLPDPRSHPFGDGGSASHDKVEDTWFGRRSARRSIDRGGSTATTRASTWVLDRQVATLVVAT